MEQDIHIKLFCSLILAYCFVVSVRLFFLKRRMRLIYKHCTVYRYNDNTVLGEV